ncbi:hypothetical protein [Brevundimonas naejangsanensis]|jgi:hypothetical protein|uniref:hypothetical protein n=1 Tax=Brevundimonas naejangsanensis TaxID=588932 RepID=UPI0004048256|nr:hypothetical protein [Brevundimonas naejangsanensis]
MRPPILLIAAIAAPLALAGCATGRGLPTYQEEMTKLDAECVARGGILSPSGMQTGRPQTDYLCKIAGGASRLPHN